jgi:hypothetical protein
VWGIAAPARSTLVVDDDGVGLEASGYAAGEASAYVSVSAYLRRAAVTSS